MLQTELTAKLDTAECIVCGHEFLGSEGVPVCGRCQPLMDALGEAFVADEFDTEEEMARIVLRALHLTTTAHVAEKCACYKPVSLDPQEA